MAKRWTLSLEDRVRTVELWRSGAQQKQIASIFGVHHMVIHRVVHDPEVNLMADLMKLEETKLPGEGRLGLRDRIEIENGLRAGVSMARIAAGIMRPTSTVSREVKREQTRRDTNGVKGGYDAVAAHVSAWHQTRRPRPTWVQTRPRLWDLVCKWMLARQWSPQQIAKRLRLVFPHRPQWWVSHESIYTAIYVQAKGELKKDLIKALRQGRAKRRPQGRAHRGVGSSIPDMVNISERPAEVEDRAVPGHWEGDLIVGKANGSAMATVFERTTRWGIVIALESKDAAHVAERISTEVPRFINEELARAGRHGIDLAPILKTLTWDQGSELANHADITANTGLDVYFCDPAKPWQRGTNENSNGLIRQWFPKGTDLSIHTQADCDRAARLLNGRPRQTLDWHTPEEKAIELLVAHTT